MTVTLHTTEGRENHMTLLWDSDDDRTHFSGQLARLLEEVVTNGNTSRCQRHERDVLDMTAYTSTELKLKNKIGYS